MNSSVPRLSIIISCFNYAEFVGRAIESVLSQQDAGFELLVVDDGSSDHSWEVIQQYRIPKSFRVENGGAARACFHAYRRSEAPFVLFLDADDELAPGSLAQIATFLDADVAKLQFALTPIDERGCVLGPSAPALTNYRMRAGLVREVVRTGSYVSPPTSGNVFCRALCDLLAEVDYEMAVDGVTLFAAPFFGDVVSIARPLGFYRLHGRNYSQSGTHPDANRFRREADRFLVRHEHLGRILAARLGESPLSDGRRAFFYRERRLYERILEGRRPTLAEVIPMLWLSLTSSRSLGYRISMMSFLCLCLCLSRPHIKAVLTYRLQTGQRSAFGLLQRLLAEPG